MTQTLKNIQKHVVASGDYALATAGQTLFTIIGSGSRRRISYNVSPGQIVAYVIEGGVTRTVDDGTLAAGDIHELYIGVGVDLDGDGVTDDIRHIGIEQVGGCDPREVSTSSPRCGSPQIMDFYFDCTECNETYSVIVRVDDNQTRSYSPWNKSFSEFVGSIVTNCNSCNDCPAEHNCKEIACKLADALNNDLDLKVGSRKYPDWKGQGLPRPFFATRLHSNSFVYCLSPQTEVGGCKDCTYIGAITGALINGTKYTFVGNTNPADATQTFPGQLDGIVQQLNDAFITEYSGGQVDVNPHAGSAYVTGSYQDCCPIQLHVNTCDASFILLGPGDVEIVETSNNNPFTTYGTDTASNNCIDCGDQDVAARGTLTFTDQPANGETVVIGSKTYTFQTTLTDVDGNVQIGATTADSIDNLVSAINLSTGAGTKYAASMTLNTQVTASEGTGLTMVVVAKTPGVAGNSIGTTDTVADASWGAATLLGGADGAAAATTQYTCGIRVIAEQIKGDCDCFMDKPLAFYGRKIDILPFGDSWTHGYWKTTEVQAMELPAGFGAFIQWLEYQTLPEGRGRRYDRSNTNKGWANLPGNKARIKNAVTARCDKNYCSYYLKSFVDNIKLDKRRGVTTVHSNLHIPSTDSTTITAWEDFLTALIALNPNCKSLTVVNCDTDLGSC